MSDKEGIDYKPQDCWAFAWASGMPKPCVTTLIAFTRRECIKAVEEFMGEPWRKTYRRGGRCIQAEIAKRLPG